MSNKFRIILFRTVFILLAFACVNFLFGFTPTRNNFVSNYQYDLYRSWLQKGNFTTQESASLKRDMIVKQFGNEANITVQYYLKNGKITDQQEALSYIFTSSQEKQFQPFVNYIQSFIYKLNANNVRFYTDLMELKHFQLRYKQTKGIKAEQLLWQDLQGNRLTISPLEFKVTSDQIIIEAKTMEDHIINWIFPINFDLQKAKKEIEQMEDRFSLYLEHKSELMSQENMILTALNFTDNKLTPSPQKMKQKQNIDMSNEQIEIPISSNDKSLVSNNKVIQPKKRNETANEQKISVAADTTTVRIERPESTLVPKQEFYAGMPLNEYLQNYLYTDVSRELLHNKISDPIFFLAEEFKDYQIETQGDSIFLTGKILKQDFSPELKLQFFQDEDGIRFQSLSQYQLKNQILHLSQHDKIDLSALSNEEAEIIGSRLPQLIYEHRSLGTKLLNFLLVHDNIPSTLIVQNSERTIYEKESYADLLLLLNRYWNYCNVYFKIDTIKKVNGSVEMLAYLIANYSETGKNDIAEIRFLLDDNYTISLIMMVLHPNAQI